MADNQREDLTRIRKVDGGIAGVDFYSCNEQDICCSGECEKQKIKIKPTEMAVKISADVGEAVAGLKRLQRELRKTTKEAREMESAINADKIASVNEVRDLQGEPGNWDVSDYMTGLYNGLEMASSILEDREPEFRDCKPDGA